jgi:chloramphenicol-sensitive protein RarD
MPVAQPPPVTSAGLCAAVIAYGAWGVLPLYLQQLGGIGPGVVLAQRIAWAFPTALAAAFALGQSREIVAALRDRRIRAALALSACLIGLNWAVYVWAVAEHRVVEASLGYFLTPLVNVALGVALLGERLRAMQAAALALAGCGVLVQALIAGAPPWLGLVLCASFATYGYVRKTTDVGAAAGMTVESLILLAPALGLMAFLAGRGEPLTPDGGAGLALVLGLFAFAARRLPLTAIGLLQYLAPTLQFLIGVAAGEPVSHGRLAGFALIWAGLAVYSVDALVMARRMKV